MPLFLSSVKACRQLTFERCLFACNTFKILVSVFVIKLLRNSATDNYYEIFNKCLVGL